MTRSYLSAMARELFSLRGIGGTCTLLATFLAIAVAVEVVSA